jgi:serine/threonine protein kinase/membrane-associated phospholipid phosphatase
MPSSVLLSQVRTVIGDQYEVHDVVGRGGMGVVFRATDRKLDRVVAIKVLPPEHAETQEVRERFIHEARIAAKLDHNNIVPIYAVEDQGEIHYFVMKFVVGRSLDEVLEKGTIPWQEAKRILWEAAQALGHAHRRGVIHRDIKPGNIMIDDEGRTLLADFGISKALAATTKLTATGVVVGTPAYLSPEQAKSLEVDGRTDQYSLGMVGYRMFAGRVAFEGESLHSLLYQQVFEAPPPLAEFCPDLPPNIVEAVERALLKDPDDRYPSMDDFAAAVWPERAPAAHGLASDSDQSFAAVQSGITSDLRQPTPGIEDTATALLSDAPLPASHAVAGKDEKDRAEPLDDARTATLTKLKWTGLLGVVFLVNYVQTAFETCCKRESTVDLGFDVATALHQIERYFQFVNHDLTNPVAVYGYSVSYFFLLPVLALMVAAFSWRKSVRAYRGFVLGITAAYAISLPFFLLFPVIERWAFPDSGAIMLSDLWTSGLIEAIRPISALDNSFPSFHTSSSIVISLTCFAYSLPLRWMTLFLSWTIILATIALGIHWVPDLIAGLAVGVLAVVLGVRIQDHRLISGSRQLSGA